jgi:hypothetical protein
LSIIFSAMYASRSVMLPHAVFPINKER